MKYWLVTIKGRGDFYQHSVLEGSLIDYVLKYKDEPIIFAQEISKEEYEKADDIL